MTHLLRNGNTPYNLALHPLCGAKRRDGGVCRAKAMRNGRCRLHGGRTPVKHGLRSKEMERMRSEVRKGIGGLTKEVEMF